MAEDSDENWDDFELELAPKLKLPEPFEQKADEPLIFPHEESDEDWDDDIEDSENILGTAAPVKLKGIKANPNAVENYEDEDFEFDSDSELGALALGKSFAPASRLPEDTKSLKDKVQPRTSSSSAIQLQYFSAIVESFPVVSRKAEVWDDISQDAVKSEEEFTKAIENLTKKLQSQTEPISQFDTHFQMGKLYQQQQKNVKALGSFKEAKLISEKSKNLGEVRIPLLIYEMGITQAAAGDYFESEKSLKEANSMLQSLEKNKKKETPSEIIHSMKGLISYQLGMNLKETEGASTASAHFAACISENSNLPPNKINWFQLGRAALYIGKWLKSSSVENLGDLYIKKAIAASNEANDKETSIEATNLQFGNSATTTSTTLDSLISSDDDSFEDWDEDLGIDPVDRFQSTDLRLDMKNPQDDESEGTILPKYKILQATEVQILSFPKATFFYTMKTKEKHTYMEEEFLKKWLGQVTKKHLLRLNHNKVHDPALKDKNKYEIKEFFFNRLESFTPFTVEWCEVFLEFCARLHITGQMETFWEEIFDFFVDLGRAPKEAFENHHFNCLILILVYLAAKHWTSQEQTSWKSILTSLKKIHPNASYLCAILDIEVQLHHNHERIDEHCKAVEQLITVYTELKEKAETSTAPNKDELSLFPISHLELQARALLDIHLSLNEISPLDCSFHNQEEEEEGHQPLCQKSSLLINEKYPELSTKGRNERLQEIYPFLPPSIVKARIAYTLGLHAIVELDDLGLAEQIFFETIYILDLIGMAVPSMPPIVSEMGTNSLLRYSEVLLHNSKYTYAIAANEQAILNYRLRKQPGFQELLKQVAFLTQKNGDLDLAVTYFKEMLDLYEKYKKKNEARWVAETLCSLYLDRGEFSQAVVAIRKALALSGVDNPNTIPLDKVSPMIFRLQMKHAEILFDSPHFEDGIELLEQLHTAQLPHGTKNTVLAKLASAYTKRNMFQEAGDVLNEWDMGRRTDTKTLAQNLKFYELQAKNEFHGRQYAAGLLTTEVAISVTDTAALSTLGDFYYLRGKIFQALCNSSTALKFPTALKPEKVAPLVASTGGVRPTGKLYSCSGDLIQEAISCFDKAYDYFCAISDDVKIGKTLARIAQVYLDRVFPPCALLLVDYREVSRLRGFSTHSNLQVLRSSDSPHNSNSGSSSNSLAQSPHSHPRRGHHRTFSDNALPDVVISHQKIEPPAQIAMDIAADTANVMVILRTYLNMAELRFLQNKKEAALAFWTECKDLLVQVFFDAQTFLLKDAPPHFIRKILEHMKRLVRMLLAFEPGFINKNLMIIDSYLLLEHMYDHSYERPLKPVKTEDIKAFTLGRSAGKRSGTIRSGHERISVMSVFDQNRGSTESHSSHGSLESPKHKSIDSALPSLQRERAARSRELAEKIWGILTAIKYQIQKYSHGKISTSELVAHNSNALRRILQTRTKEDMLEQEEKFKQQQAHPHKLIKKGLSSSRRDLMSQRESETYRIMDLQFTNRAFQKVLYALKIDDYLCFYAPLSGTKEVQRLGGKIESQNTTPTNVGVVPLNIHILAKSEECVALEAHSGATLDSVLKFLTNRPYWKEESVKKSGGSFFGTFKNTALPVRGALKYISETDDFLKHLNHLLVELGYGESHKNVDKVRDKPLTTNELTSISFSKKIIDEFNSTQKVVPVLVSSTTTIAQCFTDRELRQASDTNPLRLFLYLATNPTVEFALPKKNLKPVHLSEDVLVYLASFLRDNPDDSDLSKKAFVELAEVGFSDVSKMLLHSELNDETIGGVVPATYSPSVRKVISSPAPVSLVASKALQIFPWELFFHSLLVRFLSVQDIINSGKAAPILENELLPTYYGMYNSSSDKVLLVEQEKRREYLIQGARAKLQASNVLPSSPRNASFVSPMHSPLVKHGKKPDRAKYKLVHWLDIGIVNSPPDLIHLVDEMKTPPFSVFLMTTADMIGMPQPLYHLMRSRPGHIFVFVPANKLKLVALKLGKYHEDCLKQKGKNNPLIRNQGRLHMLMAFITQLQVENQIPISVFNAN